MAQGFRPHLPGSIDRQYLKSFGKGLLYDGQNTNEKVIINDLPFMITPDGTIVCIPKLPEQGVTALIGLPGRGKSLNASYILDQLFWSWGDYISVLNDSQEETFDWSEPCDFPEFIQRLKLINQSPMPLPMVYVFPKMFKESEEVIKNRNYIKISLPFNEVINNIEKIIPLGNSEKYLLMKREELMNAETEEEVFEVIKSIDSGESKGMKDVVHKVTAAFRELIDEGILNVSDLSVPAYLKVGDYIGNPFTAIMKAQCIPAFITSNLYFQKYKDLIFSYYINSLFDESLNGEMKGERVWIYFDELTRVVSANQRHSSPETEKALNQIVARGRNNGISLVYATQRYKEIPKSIRALTKYAIVFRHNSKEEAKEIFDDFGVGRDMRGDVLALKKFEAICFTNEYFVCYKGNKKWGQRTPLKGIILPSLHRNRFLNKQDSKEDKKEVNKCSEIKN